MVAATEDAVETVAEVDLDEMAAVVDSVAATVADVVAIEIADHGATAVLETAADREIRKPSFDADSKH